MYSPDRLFILDADGTTIDAFGAIERTFAHHHMDIGDLQRFQKRRNLFKYLGGLKEFPSNLKQQIGKQKRSRLIATLTEVYREEAVLFDGVGSLIEQLIAEPGLRVGLITRNITNEPENTLKRLFQRHGIDVGGLDFMQHISLKQEKVEHFRRVREDYRINPARAYACGDEKKDFLAALSTGMQPFMVSYGFEDFERLSASFNIRCRANALFCDRPCVSANRCSQASSRFSSDSRFSMTSVSLQGPCPWADGWLGDMAVVAGTRARLVSGHPGQRRAGGIQVFEQGD